MRDMGTVAIGSLRAVPIHVSPCTGVQHESYADCNHGALVEIVFTVKCPN